MKVQIVMMRDCGVEVPRRMLSDQYTVKHRGDLKILDVTDQGLRRPVKVARLYVRTGTPPRELIEPHIIWANENRFVLAGFERKANDAGQLVDFAQSWLCSLDSTSADADDDGSGPRPAKPVR